MALEQLNELLILKDSFYRIERIKEYASVIFEEIKNTNNETIKEAM